VCFFRIFWSDFQVASLVNFFFNLFSLCITHISTHKNLQRRWLYLNDNATKNCSKRFEFERDRDRTFFETQFLYTRKKKLYPEEEWRNLSIYTGHTPSSCLTRKNHHTQHTKKKTLAKCQDISNNWKKWLMTNSNRKWP